MAKVLIFDFDGTLAETWSAVLEVTNTLADDYGYQKITNQEALALKDKGVRELIKLFNIPMYKLPSLVIRARKELGKKIPQTKPISDIPETIKKLKAAGFQLGVVTSNSVENVQAFLKNNQIEGFDFVDSEIEVFGKGNKIKKLLKKKQISAEDAIYIGDELRDVEAARNAGLKIISVSWGFNSKESLAKAQPDWLIDKPSQLLELVK